MKKIVVMRLTMSALVSLSISTSASAQFFNWNNGPWQSWAGLYFGTYFGGGRGDADQTFNDQFRQTFTETESDFFATETDIERGSGKLTGDVTGSKADLFVGYNFHPECANYVFGGQIEGTIFSDITLKTTGNRASSSTFTSQFNGSSFTSSERENETSENSDELRSMISFIARGGYLVTPPVLIYVLAGATEGHFVVPSHDDPFGGDRAKWELGYTLGAGIEYKINENWFLRAEYRYLNFDVDRSSSNHSRSTFTETDENETRQSNFSRNSTTNLHFNAGQIGVVYRF